MTEPIKCIKVDLCLKQSTYWKLVAIAAEDQHAVEDWLDEYLPAVIDNLVNEKN